MVQGIFRQAAAIGHHHGHRVAHVSHLVPGKGVLQKAFQPLERATPHGYDLGRHHLLQVAEAEHGRHSGKGQGLRRVDGEDAGMGMGAAQDGGMKHPRQLHVVHVTRPASEKAQVFPASDGGSDVGGNHTGGCYQVNTLA